MKIHAKPVLGLLIAVGLLLITVTKSPSSNAEASAGPDNFIQCPASLVAPYGGNDGWSTIQVQANFAAALVTPQGVMVCQYGFGSPHPKPFFGIEKPCPAGNRCVAQRNGFRVIPAIR